MLIGLTAKAIKITVSQYKAHFLTFTLWKYEKI